MIDKKLKAMFLRQLEHQRFVVSNQETELRLNKERLAKMERDFAELTPPAEVKYKEVTTSSRAGGIRGRVTSWERI